MAKKMAAVSPEAPFAAGRLGIPGVDRMGQQAAQYRALDPRKP
jgi:hypothetical protein